MAAQAHITRRSLVKALPAFGAVIAGAAVTTQVVIAQGPVTLDERIAHHETELRALLAEKHQIGGWRMMATSERGIKGPMETFGL